MLLGLRTRTVRGIRCDFPGMYKDRLCPLGCGDSDTLPNILSCKVLKQHQTSDRLTNGNIKFEDIFSNDTYKQKQITELYENIGNQKQLDR